MIERLPADVEPYEVQQVLNSKWRRPVPVLSKAGARLLLIFGRTKRGRVLAVALRPGPGRHSSIISPWREREGDHRVRAVGGDTR